MRNGTWLIPAALVAAAGLAGLAGCAGHHNEGGGDEGGATITGSIYGTSGGDFVPLGGQTLAVGDHVAVSEAGTGHFDITGVPPGHYTIVVTPSDPGYGQVLNPDLLTGTIAKGQTKDIGRILLGSKPPGP
jgi:hypothetical protein